MTDLPDHELFEQRNRSKVYPFEIIHSSNLFYVYADPNHSNLTLFLFFSFFSGREGLHSHEVGIDDAPVVTPTIAEVGPAGEEDKEDCGAAPVAPGSGGETMSAQQTKVLRAILGTNKVLIFNTTCKIYIYSIHDIDLFL